LTGKLLTYFSDGEWMEDFQDTCDRKLRDYLIGKSSYIGLL
jgi:hypothetical protein